MLRVSFAGKLTCFMEQYAVPFLMVLFVAVLSACHDNLIEEGGGEVVPPEEIVTPPVYMLLDGPYKSGVTLTQNEDDSYTIETINGDPWATGSLFEEDVPEECNVLEFEYQTEMGISNLELFFVDAKNGIDATHSMSAGGVSPSKGWSSFSVRLKKVQARV